LLLPLACRSRQEAPDLWYPLDSGHHWRYRVTVEQGGTTERMQLMMRNLPSKSQEGAVAAPQQTIFGPHGSVLFVRADEEGVSQIGEATRSDQPRRYSLPVYLLRNPLEAGHTWRQVYRPVLFRDERDVPVEVRVVGTAATVQVPAGTFRDCLEVVATGRTGPRKGSPGLAVERRAWYARHVGTVKSVSTERLGGKTARISLELELQAPGAARGEAPAESPRR
jgi:hypothetical protein